MEELGFCAGCRLQRAAKGIKPATLILINCGWTRNNQIIEFGDFCPNCREITRGLLSEAIDKINLMETYYKKDISKRDETGSERQLRALE